MSAQTIPFPATVNILKAIGIEDPFLTGSPLPASPHVERSIVYRDPLMRRELDAHSRRVDSWQRANTRPRSGMIATSRFAAAGEHATPERDDRDEPIRGGWASRGAA